MRLVVLNLVSRLAFDTLANERDRLREQNDRLIETIVRLARKDKGLPEVQPEKRIPEEMLPPAVRQAILAWDSPHIQTRKEQQARACYRQTRDWNTVLELLAVPEEEE